MVYRRYFDGIFVLLKSKEHFNAFVNYIHSKYKNIKFTFKDEDFNGFSFLDSKLPAKTNCLLL